MFIKIFRKSMLHIIMAVIIVMISILTIMVVYADTDGNELRITAQPDKLVLQLGAELAGAEFELKLDSGVFPVPVKASSSGVLTMELGGSKTYTLTRITPEYVIEPLKPIPEPISIDISQLSSDIFESESGTETVREETGIIESVINGIEHPDNSIPVFPMMLFFSLLVLVVVSILIMRQLKKSRSALYDDDDE